MQDRYVGDVGDFGKYGLLRSLCREDEHGAELRLGVLWYRFDGDDSAAANDGRHTDYLFAPSRHERFLRQCDPDLFERMLHLVKNNRSIAAVEANGVLPAAPASPLARGPYQGSPASKNPAHLTKTLGDAITAAFPFAWHRPSGLDSNWVAVRLALRSAPRIAQA